MPTWHAELQGRHVVVVSPQYWGDYWVSKHWIAYKLSRHLRTVFIEPPVWVGGVLKHPSTHVVHLRRLVQPIRKVDDKLHVFTPKLLPRRLERGMGGANQRTAEALRRLGIRAPIVLNFTTNYDLVKRLNPALSVYYCVDPPFPEPGHEKDEALTCEASDLIYAVSESYREHLAQFCTRQPLHVIPHGYAFDHARRIDQDPRALCPPELRSLPRPILGFVGSIHDAYVDIDLIERLAQARPHYSIVLVGPYRANPLGPDLSLPALRRLRQLPNVHLLGPRHFLDVPHYVKHFDVGLILVNIKDYGLAAMTNKRTHFKWLAYLAMGKPIVAPQLKETDSIAALVYLAGDADDYVAAVDQALAEDGALKPLRVNYASQFSFDKTLESIAGPMALWLDRTSDRCGRGSTVA